MFVHALLLAGLLATTPADAGAHVTIVVDPFSPTYVPAPRPDYIWIAGSYDPYGVWIPGYWQPMHPRPGFVWTNGYWVGTAYHEGYWRPAGRAGYAWIDGYYIGGRYTPGRWVSEAEYAHVRAQVHEERSRGHVPASHSSARSSSHSSSHGSSSHGSSHRSKGHHK